MLFVELKFGEMRGRNWLSLAPRAEDTEAKNHLFREPLGNGISHKFIAHADICVSLHTQAPAEAARPGTGSASSGLISGMPQPEPGHINRYSAEDTSETNTPTCSWDVFLG